MSINRGLLFLRFGFVLVLPTICDISCNTDKQFILTETRSQPGRKKTGRLFRVPMAMQGGAEWEGGTRPLLMMEGGGRSLSSQPIG